MYLFCPKCNAQHPAEGRCPKCSSRLLSPGEAADVLSKVTTEPPAPVPTTFGRRIVVGTVVALGLHLAFREWAAGGAALAGWTGETAIWLGIAFALRLVGTAFGGLIAGAGRPRQFSEGAVVGAASAFAWLFIDAFPEWTFEPLQLGLAFALVATGGIASYAGSWIWPAAVDLPTPVSSRESSLLKLAKTPSEEPQYPIRWVRIILAGSLSICALLAAEPIRTGIGKLPAGLVQTLMSKERFDFQISAFALVLCGVIAGGGTGRGFVQGVLGGAIAGIGALALPILNGGELPPGVEFAVDRLGYSETPRQGTVFVAGLIWFFVAICGWFGGQLLPPVRKGRRLPRD